MIRHDPYAVPPARGEWEYVVYDQAIDRAPAGSPRLLSRSRPAVRLGPNAEFRHWRNEFVLVHETGEQAPVLKVEGSLYLLPRGTGADLLDFRAEVSDPVGDPFLTIVVPARYVRAARRKVLGVIEWYALERSRRDKGLRPLLDATELWFVPRAAERAS